MNTPRFKTGVIPIMEGGPFPVTARLDQARTDLGRALDYLERARWQLDYASREHRNTDAGLACSGIARDIASTKARVEASIGDARVLDRRIVERAERENGGTE